MRKRREYKHLKLNARHRKTKCPKCHDGLMSLDFTRTKEMSMSNPIAKICRQCGYRTFYDLDGVEVVD